ncbi:unnamed protein product, partial [Dovyalis caffra]
MRDQEESWRKLFRKKENAGEDIRHVKKRSSSRVQFQHVAKRGPTTFNVILKKNGLTCL